MARWRREPLVSLVVVSLVVLVVPFIEPEELLDMFVVLSVRAALLMSLGVPYVVFVDMLPLVVPLVFAGVFRLLLVLLVMLPVPVTPVFEPALGGVPLMSVVFVVPVLVVPLLLVPDVLFCMVVSPTIADDEDMLPEVEPLFVDVVDVVEVAVVSLLLLLPLILLRSERQPNVVMTSANRKIRVNFVLLLVIKSSPLS